MLIINKSNIRKTLQSNSGKIYFPPGISSHPYAARIMNYVKSHPDLSVVMDPVLNKVADMSGKIMEQIVTTVTQHVQAKEEELNKQKGRRRKHSNQEAVDGANS